MSEVTAALPPPMTPPECDLQDFEFMPVMVRRLLKSETWSLGDGDQRAAAVALWFESWHQVPAASLPSNDRLLARLADTPRWARAKELALRGWVLCSDGRLYHPVVAEKALEAWVEKLLNAISGAHGNAKRWQITIDTTSDEHRLRLAAELLRAIEPKSRTLRKKAVLTILSGSPADASASPPDSARESPPDSSGDRKGQGQGSITGAKAPDAGASSAAAGAGRKAKPKQASSAPEDPVKREIWWIGRPLLVAEGMGPDEAGAFIGKLIRDYGQKAVVEVMRAAAQANPKPMDLREWVTAACLRATGRRLTPVAGGQASRLASFNAGLDSLEDEIDGGGQHALVDDRTVDAAARRVE